MWRKSTRKSFTLLLHKNVKSDFSRELISGCCHEFSADCCHSHIKPGPCWMVWRHSPKTTFPLLWQLSLKSNLESRVRLSCHVGNKGRDSSLSNGGVCDGKIKLSLSERESWEIRDAFYSPARLFDNFRRPSKRKCTKKSLPDERKLKSFVFQVCGIIS